MAPTSVSDRIWPRTSPPPKSVAVGPTSECSEIGGAESGPLARTMAVAGGILGRRRSCRRWGRWREVVWFNVGPDITGPVILSAQF